MATKQILDTNESWYVLYECKREGPEIHGIKAIDFLPFDVAFWAVQDDGRVEPMIDCGHGFEIAPERMTDGFHGYMTRIAVRRK